MAFVVAGRPAQEEAPGVRVFCVVIEQLLLEKSRERGWHADRERAMLNALLDGSLSFEERRHTNLSGAC